MVLHDLQYVRDGKTAHLPETSQAIKLLCLLLCIMIMPQTAQTVFFGEYKANFQTPCTNAMILSTEVPDLSQFTLCTSIRLNSSNAWAAFSYKLTKSLSEYELGLLGDSSSLVIWISGIQINVSEKLNLYTWYEACIKWDNKSKSMEFYLDGNLKETQKLDNVTSLTGGGVVSLGCSESPRMNASAAVGLVGELYMFRMWKTASKSFIKKCIDGNVISWQMKNWIYIPSIVQQDPTLDCAKEGAAITTTLAPTVNSVAENNRNADPISLLFENVLKNVSIPIDAINVNGSISVSLQGDAILTTPMKTTVPEGSSINTTASKTSITTSLVLESTERTETKVNITTAHTSQVTTSGAASEVNITESTAHTFNVTTSVTGHGSDSSLFTAAGSSGITTVKELNPTPPKITTLGAASEVNITESTAHTSNVTTLVTGHGSDGSLFTAAGSSGITTGKELNPTPPKITTLGAASEVNITESTAKTSNVTTSVTEHGSDGSLFTAAGSSGITTGKELNPTPPKITTLVTEHGSDGSLFTAAGSSGITTGKELNPTPPKITTLVTEHGSDGSLFTAAGSSGITTGEELDSTPPKITTMVTGHESDPTLFTAAESNGITTACQEFQCNITDLCGESVYVMTFQASESVCTNITDKLNNFNSSDSTTTPMVPEVSYSFYDPSMGNCTVFIRGPSCLRVYLRLKLIAQMFIINFAAEVREVDKCCCSYMGLECPGISVLSNYCNKSTVLEDCSHSHTPGPSPGPDTDIGPGTQVTSSASTNYRSTSVSSDGKQSTITGSSASDTTSTQIISTTDDRDVIWGNLHHLHQLLLSGNYNASVVQNIVSDIESLLSGDINSQNAGKLLDVLSTLLNVSQDFIKPLSKRIIMIVDKIGLKLTFPGQSINITSDTMALAVNKVNASYFTELSFGVETSSGLQVSLGSQAPAKSDGSIVLPASLLDGLPPDDKDIASRIQFNFFDKSTLFVDSSLANNTFLVSKVISSSVANLSISNLTDNVTVTLTTYSSNQTNVSMNCVFWDFTKNNGDGGWESHGCIVANSTQYETVCKCNHLTSFAILMDVSRSQLSPEDTLILTFISYIGCGLSAIFLSVTLVTYIAFEKIRRDYPSKILIQLCAALVLLNLTFLLDPWISLYNNIPGLCISVAAFLHYFLLVSITWMGLEAFHMYFSLVKVFNTYVRKYILKFCLIGWGFPAVVVAIVLAINKDLYGIQTTGKYPNGSSDEFCWISDTVFYITVIGYFCIIFLLNISMFIVVLIQLCRIKKKKQLGYQRKTTFQDMRSVAGITFLLGITWGLAFFSWGPGKVVIIYMFTVFNTLQGFFIFIFYCVAKENVRKQWRRYLCCGKFRLAENSDWSKTATNKLGKQASKQGVSSSSSNSIQSSSNSNSTTLLVANEYSLHPNGNGIVFKERNGVSFSLPNGSVPLHDISGKLSVRNGDAGTQHTSLRRTSNRGSVHFMDQI